MTSSPGVSLPPGITLDGTLGALLICTIIAVALFGVICLQTYQYFNYYVKDPLYMKILVAIIWCLEFVHTVVIVHALYRIVVTDFGVPSFLADEPATLKTSILFSGFINTGVQGFFAYRIKVVSKRWTMPIICWSLLAVRLTCVIASSIIVLRVKIPEFASHYKWLLTLLLVATAIGDLVVAGALAYFLSQGRSGFLKTDHVVNELILFSIETGLVTSLVAMAVLIIFLTKPTTFAWIGMLLTLAKIYTNSLLLSLNNRKHLRSEFVGYNDSRRSELQPHKARGIALEMNSMTATFSSPLEHKNDNRFMEDNGERGAI
ncbi:hypothetical protein BDZ94DRAFT_693505 [Collybia nuda]|uniref:DUF6534 domain-containing protein n=1 Tax=Collybia nuda TaxID=64659 RepID=A0A9P5YG91_9AGAR|nr:hypothetical protein BDZ94DRAFT_693505 [Collybia nuda]